MDTDFRRQYILDRWKSYRREVIPSNAPAVQIIESRRAFYAGAKAMLSVPPGRHQIEAIRRELDQFADLEVT